MCTGDYGRGHMTIIYSHPQTGIVLMEISIKIKI
jgi:uncharacterized protein (UPF0218 family)